MFLQGGQTSKRLAHQIKRPWTFKETHSGFLRWQLLSPRGRNTALFSRVVRPERCCAFAGISLAPSGVKLVFAAELVSHRKRSRFSLFCGRMLDRGTLCLTWFVVLIYSFLSVLRVPVGVQQALSVWCSDLGA